MASNNEYMREYMLKRYYRRWDSAVESLGGKCVKCGSIENLNFDHIDPSTKEFEIGSRLAGVAQAKLETELKKCQLLCEGCHIAKTKEDFGQPPEPLHGTLTRSTGKHRCKCDACKKAKADYMSEYSWRTGRRNKRVKKPLIHGERRSYTKGCRCLDCTRSQRDYMRVYNAKRKS